MVYIVTVLRAGQVDYVGVFRTRADAERAAQELQRDYRGARVDVDARPVIG